MNFPGGNSRLRARDGDGRGGVLGLFLLVNILPIGGLVYAAFKWSRGELPVDKLPKGLGFHGGALAAALFALFVVARWSLPVVHAVVRWAEQGLGMRRRIVDGAQKGNPVRAVLMLPVYAALWVVAFPIRFAMIVVSFALIAAIVVGIARFFDPAFAVAWGVPATLEAAVKGG